MAVWAVVMVLACSKDSTAPKVEYTLEVVAGNGVVSSPKVGTYKYPAGKSIPYSFTAGAGYRNVVAEEDGKSLPISGNIVMSADRKLFAVAELTPVLLPESQTLGAGIAKFVAAKDSASIISAYSQHLAELGDLYTRDPSHARDLALAAYSNVLEKSSITDMDRAERALSGRLFSTSSLSAVKASASTPQITLIFVNGIWNWVDGPIISIKEIEGIIRESGSASKVGVYNFYNASLTYEPSGLKRCLVKTVELKSFKELMDCPRVGDLSESLHQITTLSNSLPNEELPKSRALAQIITEERSTGRAVIMLGHSQGTLLIQEALRVSESDKCVLSISIAGPLGKSSWKEVPSGFVVAGDRMRDFILDLGQNDFERFPTSLTKSADKDFDLLGIVSPAFAIAYKFFGEFSLHQMGSSYLAAPESRVKIASIISNDVATLEKNPECQKPRGGLIYASSGRLSGGLTSGPSDLWSVSPLSDGADTKIARLKNKSGSEPAITDLAEHPDGSLWAVSYDSLYRVNRETGIIEGVFKFDSPMNAMTFDTKGRIYAASTDGKIVGLEISPLRIFFRGEFGPTLHSSGDLAFSPGGILYAVVEDDRSQSALATVDLENGRIKLVSAATIGFTNAWGISFVGNVLYGLTSDPVSSFGKLITIDVATGKGTLVRGLGFNAFGASLKAP
ncbi:hypothetical protein KW796_00825 [Candidatus Parcubacteria bacterium]|nr:hypothetical protein [Candidatus Parcubacteria bacterium]